MTFVKAKRHIRTEPATKPAPNDLEVYDVGNFLEKVAPETTELASLKSPLEEFIDSTRDRIGDGPVLSALAAEESCAVLQAAITKLEDVETSMAEYMNYSRLGSDDRWLF